MMFDDLLGRPPATSTDTIRKDRLDRLDWMSAQELDPLQDAAGALAGIDAAAPDVLSDLFSSFYKAHPEVIERERVAPSHLLNREVMAAVLDSDAYSDLRRFTVRDQAASALACITYRDHLAPLFERAAAQTAEETAEAQAAQNDLDALLAALDDTEAEPTEAEVEAIAAAQQRAEQARGALADKLEGMAPQMGRAARRAGAEAVAEAEEADATMSSWGVDRGTRGRMDPAARLALAQRLATPRMRRITELLGAMRNLSWGARRRKFDALPEEIFDVTLGHDVGRLLGSEYAALAVPELEDLFYLRLVTDQLTQYDLRGLVHQGRGAIIYVEDGSGSMRFGGGEKELWAKGFGLALLGVAKDEGRAFHAIHFGGDDEAQVFSFPEPAAFTTEAMLAYAETFLDAGGTNFRYPLGLALEMLDAEHAATGHTSADIILATDGDDGGNVIPWLPEFHAERERLGFKGYGVAIGCAPNTPSLAGVCVDGVATVRALSTGDDVVDVFKALA
jgi:uncharacterized protein with von Willebrand factor type A (vWA) domain